MSEASTAYTLEAPACIPTQTHAGCHTDYHTGCHTGCHTGYNTGYHACYHTGHHACCHTGYHMLSQTITQAITKTTTQAVTPKPHFCSNNKMRSSLAVVIRLEPYGCSCVEAQELVGLAARQGVQPPFDGASAHNRSRTRSTAGLVHTALEWGSPTCAAKRDRIPEPAPTSMTALPSKSPRLSVMAARPSPHHTPLSFSTPELQTTAWATQSKVQWIKALKWVGPVTHL